MLQSGFFTRIEWDSIAKHFDLTSREKEVVNLVAEGMAEEEIASSLRIARGTVKTHMRNVYRKISFDKKANKIRMLLKFREHTQTFEGARV